MRTLSFLSAALRIACTFFPLQTTSTDGSEHGLINYIDNKAKCKGTLRQVSISVYRLEIPSFMLVFSSQLCELLSLCPSLWFNSLPSPSPLPSVIKYTVCTYAVCKGGGYGVCWRPYSVFCIWPDSEPTKLLHFPRQKRKRGEGLRLIKTCSKVSSE
jgi:hypothetical protein